MALLGLKSSSKKIIKMYLQEGMSMHAYCNIKIPFARKEMNPFKPIEFTLLNRF